MTRDFTCSVSEFTSSTGSIHVNSVNTFAVSTHVYREITSFSRASETCFDSVRLMSNSFKTRDNRHNMCIHMNTDENTYWWSGINYEPV